MPSAARRGRRGKLLRRATRRRHLQVRPVAASIPARPGRRARPTAPAAGWPGGRPLVRKRQQHPPREQVGQPTGRASAGPPRRRRGRRPATRRSRARAAGRGTEVSTNGRAPRFSRLSSPSTTRTTGWAGRGRAGTGLTAALDLAGEPVTNRRMRSGSAGESTPPQCGSPRTQPAPSCFWPDHVEVGLVRAEAVDQADDQRAGGAGPAGLRAAGDNEAFGVREVEDGGELGWFGRFVDQANGTAVAGTVGRGRRGPQRTGDAAGSGAAAVGAAAGGQLLAPPTRGRDMSDWSVTSGRATEASSGGRGSPTGDSRSDARPAPARRPPVAGGLPR